MWYLACCCVAGRRLVQLLVDLFLEHQGFVSCLKWFLFFNLELENEENIYINLNISHIQHFFTHNFSRLFAISKLCEIAVPILRGAKNGICRSIEKQIVIHSDCNFPQRREKRTQRRQKLHSGQYNNSDHTIAKKKVSDHTIQCLFQAIYLSLSDSFGVFSVPTFSFIQVFLLKVASIFV